MIEANAWVVKREQDETWVETERRSSCGNCSVKGCGTGTLASLFKSKTVAMRVENDVDAKLGDEVVVAIPEALMLRGTLLVYIIPLLAMLLAALMMDMTLAESVTDKSRELWLAGSGLAGLGLGFWGLRLYLAQGRVKEQYQGTIVRVVNASEHPVHFHFPS